MTTKEKVLEMYPDSVCIREEAHHHLFGCVIWSIISHDNLLSRSYISEETAWNWALSIINHKFLNKLIN